MAITIRISYEEISVDVKTEALVQLDYGRN